MKARRLFLLAECSPHALCQGCQGQHHNCVRRRQPMPPCSCKKFPRICLRISLLTTATAAWSRFKIRSDEPGQDATYLFLPCDYCTRKPVQIAPRNVVAARLTIHNVQCPLTVRWCHEIDVTKSEIASRRPRFAYLTLLIRYVRLHERQTSLANTRMTLKCMPILNTPCASCPATQLADIVL